MSRINTKLLFAWLCIIAGISIYMLFRSRQHLGFIVIDTIGLGTLVDSLRATVADVTPPEFVRFCLPDGLWTTSYILFADNTFRNEPPRTRLVWAGIIPLIGAVTEILQHYGVMPGVFDPLDLAVYTTPYIIYITLITLNKRL